MVDLPALEVIYLDKSDHSFLEIPSEAKKLFL